MTTTVLAPTGIDATFYAAKDMKRARAFYENALGMVPAWVHESGNFVEYELGDGATFGLAHLPDMKWYAGGGIMFAVPDVEAALERALAAGGRVEGEIYDGPVCKMVWCFDPEGNNFAFHKRKAA